MEIDNNFIVYYFKLRSKQLFLKAQMQLMQEQHGKQIRNLQGIHNQELEARDKEISRLNILLEKAFKWFPMLRRC